MKTLFSTGILLFSIISLSLSTPILEREWKFETDQGTIGDFTFTIGDTLSVAIHFPDLIPLDFLPGYCRLAIEIPDTIVLSKTGYTTAFRIDFDAGFLYFNHTLTFKLNYKSGILPSVMTDPTRFMMFCDPFPVTKIHQWFNIDSENDSFFIDSANSVVGFYYNHQGDTSTLASRVVSTGYPYLYGVFYKGDVEIKQLLLDGNKGPVLFKLKIDHHQKTIRLVSESTVAQRSLHIRLQSINGRTKAVSKDGNMVSYGNCSAGIYIISVFTDRMENIYNNTILIR